MHQSITFAALSLIAGKAAAECFSAEYLYQPLGDPDHVFQVWLYKAPQGEGSDDNTICTYTVDEQSEEHKPGDLDGFMDCEDGYEASYDSVLNIEEDEYEPKVTLKDGDNDLQEIVFDATVETFFPPAAVGKGKGEVGC